MVGHSSPPCHPKPSVWSKSSGRSSPSRIAAASAAAASSIGSWAMSSAKPTSSSIPLPAREVRSKSALEMSPLPSVHCKKIPVKFTGIGCAARCQPIPVIFTLQTVHEVTVCRDFHGEKAVSLRCKPYTKLRCAVHEVTVCRDFHGEKAVNIRCEAYMKVRCAVIFTVRKLWIYGANRTWSYGVAWFLRW